MLLGAWILRLGASPLEDFVTAARERHGGAGERAARFLVAHMPDADREVLTAEFLIANLDLAFRARSEFPWAGDVPEDLFHNDVLPYAVFDERRDPWRAELLEIARGLVKDARTVSDAVQALNRGLFNAVNIHYHTGRKRPNQSYLESKETGRATCTGLYILLVEACRAVGIPARAVGTPMWTNLRGNHTWVEVWDGDWHFTGADEYDAGGLDRGWFVGDAAGARADEPRHAIYATSWRREGLSFPMVWKRQDDSVAAVNVTARYARAQDADSGEWARLGVRLWDTRGGSRLAAKVCVVDGVRRTCALADTKAGTADLNDMPRFTLRPGSRGWLRFTVGSEIREMPFGPLEGEDPTVDAVWSDLAPASAVVEALRAWLERPVDGRDPGDPALQAHLTRAEADRVLELFVADQRARLAAERAAEMAAREIAVDGKTLRWMEREFGTAPAGGRSLWISMHGGGGAPARVNDRQWTNQIGLYQPEEGIYLAPRAPTDTWNLWHEGHIDPMFDRLIEDYVALRGVDPDRVYLMGYSAGGDGVWQLGPRMADRFAAASMMAGHPNEASLLGLRNLPFAIFMGGDDAAYDRNTVAARRGEELARLRAADPDGYPHQVRIYEGLGHWMNRRDAEALPWMAGFRRDPWPRRVVWEQDDVVHRRFYWLEVPREAVLKERARVTATVDGQRIDLDGDLPAAWGLRLSDRLVDLDQPVTVSRGGRVLFSGPVHRTAWAIRRSLDQRADPASAGPGWLSLTPGE